MVGEFFHLCDGSLAIAHLLIELGLGIGYALVHAVELLHAVEGGNGLGVILFVVVV